MQDISLFTSATTRRLTALRQLKSITRAYNPVHARIQSIWSDRRADKKQDKALEPSQHEVLLFSVGRFPLEIHSQFQPVMTSALIGRGCWNLLSTSEEGNGGPGGGCIIGGRQVVEVVLTLELWVELW